MKKARDEVASMEGNDLSTVCLDHLSNYLFIPFLDPNAHSSEKMKQALAEKDLDLAATQKEAKEKTALADISWLQ